jgi:hypothetical protein
VDNSRDWSWLGPRVKQTAAATPIQTRLWTATKDGRRAELWVRQHPLGQELRCYFNDSLLWSEVHKPGEGRQLGEVADEHKAAWVAKGWTID